MIRMLRTWHGCLFLITALLLITVMGVTIRAALLMEQRVQWVLHTEETIARFLKLRGLLSEVESDERGHLITGSQPLLDRFSAERQKISEQLDDLRVATQDNEAQQALLSEIEELIGARFRMLDRVLAMHKANEPAEKISPLIREGSEMMAALLRRMDEGLDAEARLFHERESGRREQVRTLTVTTVGSLLLALGTAIVGYMQFHRSSKEALRVAALEAQKLRAERSEHMKSRFLASMSHEIRTPMNAILGFAELLSDSKLSERDKTYVQSIRTSGKALLELINDVLDLSRLEAARMPLKPQPSNVRAVVESARVMIAQAAAEKGLKLAFRVSSDVPENLLIDEMRVRQVLLNLATNAVKFTSEGSVKVEVFCDPSEADSPMVDLTIQVTDTGIGIAPEEQQSVFSAFERAVSADHLAAQGTGLGLSITQRLVEMMRGKIKLRSAPGEGSTFTVILPRVPLAAMPEHTEDSQPVDFNLLKPSRILIADDLAANRDLLAGYFAGSHHHLIFAKDGMEALDRAQLEKPDLILMDIRMPRMDGTWARQLLQDSETGKRIPVIAQTASSLSGQSERFIKFFDGYLRKPFSRRELFLTLEHYLKRKPNDTQPLVAKIIGEAAALPSSLEQAATWSRLASDLKTAEQPTAERLCETLPMLEIMAFARGLRGRADADSCSPLRDYVDKLMRAADAFELEAVESQLKEFPKLVSRLAMQPSPTIT